MPAAPPVTYPGVYLQEVESPVLFIGGMGPSANAALNFPRLRKANPLHDNQIETFAPSGAVAGVIPAPIRSGASGRRLQG